jgi:hypothetical protein
MRRVRGIYRWTDCGYLAGWRMQVHYRNGGYRILDGHNRIVFHGTEAGCRQRLEEIGQREHLSLPTERLIVLLHGLGRNAWTMSSLARYLARSWPGTETVLYQYASTSAPVVEHARHFIRFMEYAQQSSQVHFVAHSLGNIVLRRAFRLAELNQWRLPRLGNLVMLAPPNQGSQLALRMRSFAPVAWFTGAPLQQMGRDWRSFEQELAIPACPFGIIAGRMPGLEGFHPFLSGANDAIVTVEETQLPGASDFLEVNVPHSWLMNSPSVRAATLSFLKSGRFQATEAVAPVQSAPAKE